MAIYHCSMKIISRGKGKSAVAAAAYRSGTKLVNQWDGMVHDYTHKGGIVHTDILLPAHAPLVFLDRSTLWNSVEKSEKNRNAQLAREIEIALPNELSRAEQLRLVQNYCAHFVEAGMCVDYAIHAPKKQQENVHAHILLTLRSIQSNGEWEAKCRKAYDLDEHGKRISNGKGGWKNHRVNVTDWNDPNKAEQWRKLWATMVNQSLTENHLSERVDHRSFARQGVKQIPSIHMGVAATQMEKRGIATEKGNVNRSIAKQNQMLREVKARLYRLYQWSKAEKDHDQQDPLALFVCQMSSASPTSSTLFGKVRNLKEQSQMLAFLQSNHIVSLEALHDKHTQMQSNYYDLRGDIRKTERAIKERTDHLSHWSQYIQGRALVKHIASLRPKEQSKAKEMHRAELLRYEVSLRYIQNLKKQGIKLTPKRWQSEQLALTKHKDLM